MKVSVLTAIASCMLISAGLAGPADASVRKTTNIPAESLSDALRTLAKDRQFEILYRAEVVRDVRTEGAIGEFTPEEALKAVLSGTGLSYKYLDANTVTVFPQSLSQENSNRSNATSGDSSESSQKEVGKNSSQDFRMAQVGRNAAGTQVVMNPAQSALGDQSGGPALTEIIVTAQKREERLQDVPVSVTAISSQTLLESNQLRLQDYYTLIPGLSVAPSAQSQELVTIRGITTGLNSNPAVGVVVDDLPFGSSTNTGGGLVVPDIDPSDLSRVEVLRGPQGTLYGASSMGGLLKFVTVDPSTDAVTGRAEVGTSDVYNGSHAGYNVRGSINVPLSDSWAIRASAFTRRDPGYIDNPVIGARGVNEVDVYGGHLSALWRPSDAVSLKLSALLQETHGYGSNDVDELPGLGDLQQNYVRGTGQFDRKIQSYSATLRAKLGSVDVTAISGYSISSFSDVLDATYDYGQFYTLPLFGVIGTALPEHSKTNKYSQELRFSGEIGQNLDWLVGGFYTHEKSPFEQNIVALNSATGAAVGSPEVITFPTTYEEYAAFGDLTYHLTSQIDVQAGIRAGKINQSYQATTEGPYNYYFYSTAGPVIIPETHSSGSPVTYLLTPRYRLSEDLMVYARFATGYRAGGPNTGFAVPPQYSPDKTQSYEIGAKGDILDHRVFIDASIYHINWKDIQILLFTPPPQSAGYIANAPEAKSDGEELSVEFRPLRGLTIAAWGAWNQAVLTQDFPSNASVYGVTGNQLPYTSRFSAHFSTEGEFPLTAGVTGFVGGSVSYVGDRQGEFTGSAQRQDLPAYAKTDFRTGAKFDTWTLNIFLTNAFDRRGVLTGGLGTIIPYSFYLIQPRTAGLSLAKTF